MNLYSASVSKVSQLHSTALMEHEEPEQVTSLFFDNKKIPNMRRLIEPSATQNVLSEYRNLTFLSLANVQLASLENFPAMDKLKRVNHNAW